MNYFRIWTFVSKLITNTSSSILKDILFNDIMPNTNDVIIKFLSYPFIVNILNQALVDDLFGNWNQSYNNMINSFLHEDKIKSTSTLLKANRCILELMMKSVDQYRLFSLQFLILSLSTILSALLSIENDDDNDDNDKKIKLLEYNYHLIFKLISKSIILFEKYISDDKYDDESKRHLINHMNNNVLLLFKGSFKNVKYTSSMVEKIHEMIFSETNKKSFWNICKLNYTKEMIVLWQISFNYLNELFNNENKVGERLLKVIYPLIKEGLSISTKKINEIAIQFYRSCYYKLNGGDFSPPRGLSKLLEEFRVKYDLSIPIHDNIDESLSSTGNITSSPFGGPSSFEGFVPSPSLLYPYGNIIVFKLIFQY